MQLVSAQPKSQHDLTPSPASYSRRRLLSGPGSGDRVASPVATLHSTIFPTLRSLVVGVGIHKLETLKCNIDACLVKIVDTTDYLSNLN